MPGYVLPRTLLNLPYLTRNEMRSAARVRSSALQNGESIVYSGQGALGSEIRVVNADGTGEQSITDPPTEGIDPVWLPFRGEERDGSPDSRDRFDLLA
jgi:hypothetical protein